MKQEDYRLIRVGDAQVGLIGLGEIFEELRHRRTEPEAVLKELLVEKAGKKNYIAPSARERYERALLREFKRFLGEDVEEERSGFLEVSILGPGCYTCNKLEQDVMAVLAETGIPADLNHISDPMQIAQYGIVFTPALVINGKLKSKGTLPTKAMIKRWLEEERREG